jgi:hypothetical protein
MRVEPGAPVRVFDASEDRPSLPAVPAESLPDGPSELQVLVERLTGDRPPVHQVWVAPLDPAEPLDAVLTDPPWWRGRERAEGLRAVLGLSTAWPSSAPSRSRSTSRAPAATSLWSARRAPARAQSCGYWPHR